MTNGRPLVRTAFLDVGFNDQLAAAAKACAIDLEVFHDPRDVIAGLGNRNTLDPVDRVDAGVSGVAIGFDPLLHTAAPGIVASESENVGTVITAEQIGKLGGAHLHVVHGVFEQTVTIVGDLEFGGGVDASGGRRLPAAHSTWALERP